MNQIKQNSPQPTRKSIFFARLQLLMLMAVFAAPLIGAYYLYSQRDNLNLNTVNSGELYKTPQDLPDLEISVNNDSPLLFNQLDKKWYLLVVIDDKCDALCEEALLKIRQLRRMQGKNINRIVSVMVHRGLSVGEADDLAAKYSIAQMTAADSAQFDSWLKPFYTARGASKFDFNRIYVVDPLKKLMMSYPQEVEPKLFYKDLKRLLKVSQVG